MGVLYFARHVVTARATRLALTVIGVVATASINAGCQTSAPLITQRLIAHQAMIDFSGLKPAETIESVRVSCGVPRQWEVMPLQHTPLFAHQQWRSPSGHTGVGVGLIHLPLPLGAGAVLWFAKARYTEKADDGRLIGDWTDSLGRCWFEAENKKYHVRGFAVADGFTAWVVYFGCKRAFPPDPAELSLAARCAETIVPQTSRAKKPSTQPAAQR